MQILDERFGTNHDRGHVAADLENGDFLTLFEFGAARDSINVSLGGVGRR